MENDASVHKPIGSPQNTAANLAGQFLKAKKEAWLTRPQTEILKNMIRQELNIKVYSKIYFIRNDNKCFRLQIVRSGSGLLRDVSNN